MHEVTAALGVCEDDGGELTFKTLFCHNGIPPFLKVSNKGTKYVGYSKERNS